MSDFDEEAEREKLREKYEREEAKRETTEQMSELLLKGATMTNAHCGDCGDPIFRYDGQEFCPTCQKPVDRGGDEGDPAERGQSDERTGEEAPEENGQPQGGIEVTAPSDDATVQFGGSSGVDSGSSPSESDARTAEESPSGGSPVDQSGPDQSVDSVPSAAPSESTSPSEPTPANDQSTDAPAPSNGTASEHLGRAQRTLAQTVERFARRAAAADSPREAREHLETAREAAETLDATKF